MRSMSRAFERLPPGKLTYEDYVGLPGDGRRYEILDGELEVSPAPAPRHQGVSGNLFFILYGHVQERVPAADERIGAHPRRFQARGEEDLVQLRAHRQLHPAAHERLADPAAEQLMQRRDRLRHHYPAHVHPVECGEAIVAHRAQRRPQGGGGVRRIHEDQATDDRIEVALHFDLADVSGDRCHDRRRRRGPGARPRSAAGAWSSRRAPRWGRRWRTGKTLMPTPSSFTVDVDSETSTSSSAPSTRPSPARRRSSTTRSSASTARTRTRSCSLNARKNSETGRTTGAAAASDASQRSQASRLAAPQSSGSNEMAPVIRPRSSTPVSHRYSTSNRPASGSPVHSTRSRARRSPYVPTSCRS